MSRMKTSQWEMVLCHVDRVGFVVELTGNLWTLAEPTGKVLFGETSRPKMYAFLRGFVMGFGIAENDIYEN